MVTSFLFIDEMEEENRCTLDKETGQAAAHGVATPGICVCALGCEVNAFSSNRGSRRSRLRLRKVSGSQRQDILAVRILCGRSRAVHCGMPTTSLASAHTMPAAPTQL